MKATDSKGESKMKKSKRLAIMMKHRELVDMGKLEVAHKLFTLLRKHVVSLYLSDADYEAEIILDRLGCHLSYPTGGIYSLAYDYSK